MSNFATCSRWNLVKDLVNDCLEMNTSDRLIYLKLICGNDLLLYQEVISLLEVDEADVHFLEDTRWFTSKGAVGSGKRYDLAKLWPRRRTHA